MDATERARRIEIAAAKLNWLRDLYNPAVGNCDYWSQDVNRRFMGNEFFLTDSGLVAGIEWLLAHGWAIERWRDCYSAQLRNTPTHYEDDDLRDVVLMALTEGGG